MEEMNNRNNTWIRYSKIVICYEIENKEKKIENDMIESNRNF